MFLFDWLFGRKKAAGAAPVAAQALPAAGEISAPGTTIHYDPTLMAALHREHQLLLEVFGAIGAAAEAGDLKTVAERLGHFHLVLREHLLKENVRLYVYLEHLLGKDPEQHAVMHGFHREMDGIGRAVMGFLGKYEVIADKPELAASLSADLAQIGAALSSRIQREEATLYPMYRPPQ